MSIRSAVVAIAGFASLALISCATANASREPPVDELVRLSKESNAALLRGDVDRYLELIRVAEDFTLMSPFGGKPTHGIDQKRMDAMRSFFKDGTLEQELVHAYASPDMVVLAIIERARVAVGNLPVQEWALRVTLVYRRQGSEWQLSHRHADPLAHGIDMEQAAVLGRGEGPR